MKTIKGATSPKSGILNYLKLPILMLIALVGFISGGANHATSKAAVVAETIVNHPIEPIGCGQGRPRLFSNLFAIEKASGNFVSHSSLEDATLSDGPSLSETKKAIGFSNLMEIGGGQTLPRTFQFSAPIKRRVTQEFIVAIGGTQNPPRPFIEPIGGNSCVRCGSFAVENKNADSEVVLATVKENKYFVGLTVVDEPIPQYALDVDVLPDLQLAL